MPIITMLHSPRVQLALTSWHKNMIRKTGERMPGGTFRNSQNGKMEKCSGIVMFASGDICPIFRNTVCSLLPLHYNYQHSYVTMLTGPVAGTMDCRTNNISMAVNKYNEDLLTTIDSVGIIAYGGNIVVAYQALQPDWE
jgi:hypothetical protein